MQKERLVLPVAILLASIVIGGFYYASQANKQKSIEKQQIIKIDEERRTKEEEKRVSEQKANEQKEKEIAEELEEREAKCFEDAKKFHENYIHYVRGYYKEPKYNYNKKIGKCLYNGGYSKNSEMLPMSDKDFDKKVKSPEYYWERIVKDVYTNETIVSIFNFQDSETIMARDKEIEELMDN